jgi:hypothetical protein
MTSYTDKELQKIREDCRAYKKIGCCGENLPKDFPLKTECPDNETCPASTK